MKKLHTIVGGTIGTNCYCLEENGRAIAFDYVPALENCLFAHNLTLDALFITHIHFDHIELLSLFQKKNDFILYLTEYAKTYINDPVKNLLSFAGIPQSADLPPIELSHAHTVSHEEIIKWEDHTFEIVETPGHCPSSICIIDHEEKFVISGDTLFQGSVGRTDFPEGSMETLLSSIKLLFAKTDDDYAVFPGHGPQTTIGFEKQHNPFLAG